MKKTQTVAGLYVRVSTVNGQSTELQEDALKEYAQRRGWAYKVYADRGESGAKESRPGLDALLADARRRKVDVVVVWALDRLARSLKQLLTLLDEWRTLGVDFVSFKQELDTSTAAGRMIFQVLGACLSRESQTSCTQPDTRQPALRNHVVDRSAGEPKQVRHLVYRE